MSPRAIRRAAERQAEKRHSATAPHTTATDAVSSKSASPEISAARLSANQANAQLSTGPRTPEGKAKVSLNAVKTALTGCTVLLPADDAAAYQQHILDYQQLWSPVGVEEGALVQSLADIRWRLNRIPALHFAFAAQGAIDFADMFTDLPPAVRSARIDFQTYLKYERQIHNLQLQEARLVRRREKELIELRLMQEKRQEQLNKARARATDLYLMAQHRGETFNPAHHGFEFSIHEIQLHVSRLPAHIKASILNRALEAQPQTMPRAA